jgi:hypothetical protein
MIGPNLSIWANQRYRLKITGGHTDTAAIAHGYINDSWFIGINFKDGSHFTTVPSRARVTNLADYPIDPGD